MTFLQASFTLIKIHQNSKDNIEQLVVVGIFSEQMQGFPGKSK